MTREIKSPPATILSAHSYDGKHSIIFNEASHRYKLDGKPAVGVTTFLKGGYPTSMGLISWFKTQTAEALFQSLTVPGEEGYYPREGFWPIHEATKLELFKTARAADRAVSQEAADVGTLIHEYAFLEETKGDTTGLLATLQTLPEEIQKKIFNGVDKFKDWRCKNPDEFVAAESLVASPRYLFCGKIDKLGRRNGKLILSDYKSSKSIYLDQFIQLGAYSLAIQEWMGLRVEGLEVLRFGKEDGEFETLLVDDPQEIIMFQQQAVRCRDTFEFQKMNNDPRWKWEGK